jgi:RimJ/RimL family protein N-acetyltransferase
VDELLRTSRLLLRPWCEDDLAAFFDLYRRDEVVRWLGPHPRRPLTTPEQALERLQRWRDRQAELDPPMGLWAVAEKLADTSPLGPVLLLPLHDARGPTSEVEIGWHLHPAHQGRGIATEAAGALLDAAAQARIPQVLALTDLDNARSQALALRLGMRDEGTTDRWFAITTRQYRKALVSSTPD